MQLHNYYSIPTKKTQEPTLGLIGRENLRVKCVRNKFLNKCFQQMFSTKFFNKCFRNKFLRNKFLKKCFQQMFSKKFFQQMFSQKISRTNVFKKVFSTNVFAKNFSLRGCCSNRGPTRGTERSGVGDSALVSENYYLLLPSIMLPSIMFTSIMLHMPKQITCVHF